MNLYRTALLALALHGFVHAQDEALVTITGTTTPDVSVANRHWAYLLWEPGNDALLAGKSLAIYSKPGNANSPGTYTREGIFTPKVDAKLYAPLLERAGSMGDNLPVLSALLDGITFHLDMLGNPAAYRTDRPGNPQPPFPPLSINSALPIGTKLEFVLKKASQHPKVLEGMDGMKSRHPGMAMCLGRAWAGIMPQSLMTYEVREFDLVSDSDLAVIGRVSLNQATPTPLVAPGAPVQVPNQAPEGDLNVRLRWATPNQLRRLGPQVQGYLVYRMNWADAQTLGWNTTAPSSTAFDAELASGESSLRLNTYAHVPVIPEAPIKVPMPVLTTKFFSADDVANFISDTPKGPTYFYADDNHRYDDMLPGAPFQDQSEFAYFVRARDLLGRLGPPSAGGYGIACKTMPPDVPDRVTATPTFEMFLGVERQKVVIKWKANHNEGHARPTTHYEVLRTRDLTKLTNNDGSPQIAPPLNINLDPIAHTSDDATMSFEDTTLEADFSPGESVAYCVRAVRDPVGPCGPFYSAPSPPVIVALRDYTGPPAPSGEIVSMHCPAPFVAAGVVTDGGAAPADGKQHFRVVCERREEQISAIVIGALNKSTFQTVFQSPKLNFAPHQKTLTYDFTYSTRNIHLSVVAIATDGSVSWPYGMPADFSQQLGTQDRINIITVKAGMVTPCGKQLGDPIAVASQGRKFKPQQASTASYPNLFNGETVAILSPGTAQGGGYQMTEGAVIVVTARAANGGVTFVAFATAASGNSFLFPDPAATGLTTQQLLDRYLCFTFDKVPVIPVEHVLLQKDWINLTLPSDAELPIGTQVCVTKTSTGGEIVVGGSMVRSDGSVSVQDRTGDITRVYKIYPFLGPAIPGRCPHIPVANDGTKKTIVPISVSLTLPPTTREYRVYRRVDQGPLTLIAQGIAPLGEALEPDAEPPIDEVIRTDDSMPQVNCDVCYYAQAIDKNANPSPMALIKCLRIGVSESTPLPTPLVTPPKLVSLPGNVWALEAKWVCSAPGVDRFAIMLVGDKAPEPTLPLPPNSIQFDNSISLFDAKTGATKKFYLKEVRKTDRVGTPQMGPGPAFFFTLPVTPGDNYWIAIQAQGPEKFDDEGFDIQSTGEWSQAVSIKVPSTPSTVIHTPVPWPFRDMPPVSTHDDVTITKLFYDDDTVFLMKPNNVGAAAAGVRIANIGGSSGTISNGDGYLWVFNKDPNLRLYEITDPADKLPVISVLPAVLYRQEVRYQPNSEIELPPSERAPVVQCSPMITQMTYTTIPPGNPQEGKHVLNDPAVFALRYQSTEHSEAFLMDKLPVTLRRQYRYWLVHFSPFNEPDRVIYCGTIQY